MKRLEEALDSDPVLEHLDAQTAALPREAKLASYPATWPQLCHSLCNCAMDEVPGLLNGFPGKKRAQKDAGIVFRTLMKFLHAAHASGKRKGSQFVLHRKAGKLFSTLTFVLKKLSLDSQYTHECNALLRTFLLQAPVYCTQASVLVKQELLRLYVTWLSGERYVCSRDKFFQGVDIVRLILQNVPGDINNEDRYGLCRFFIRIISALDDYSRIGFAVLSALNAFLLCHGLDVVSQVERIASLIHNLAVNQWSKSRHNGFRKALATFILIEHSLALGASRTITKDVMALVAKDLSGSDRDHFLRDLCASNQYCRMSALVVSHCLHELCSETSSYSRGAKRVKTGTWHERVWSSAMGMPCEWGPTVCRLLCDHPRQLQRRVLVDWLRESESKVMSLDTSISRINTDQSLVWLFRIVNHLALAFQKLGPLTDDSYDRAADKDVIPLWTSLWARVSKWTTRSAGAGAHLKTEVFLLLSNIMLLKNVPYALMPDVLNERVWADVAGPIVLLFLASSMCSANRALRRMIWQNGESFQKLLWYACTKRDDGFVKFKDPRTGEVVSAQLVTVIMLLASSQGEEEEDLEGALLELSHVISRTTWSSLLSGENAGGLAKFTSSHRRDMAWDSNVRPCVSGELRFKMQKMQKNPFVSGMLQGLLETFSQGHKRTADPNALTWLLVYLSICEVMQRCAIHPANRGVDTRHSTDIDPFLDAWIGERTFLVFLEEIMERRDTFLMGSKSDRIDTICLLAHQASRLTFQQARGPAESTAEDGIDTLKFGTLDAMTEAKAKLGKLTGDILNALVCQLDGMIDGIPQGNSGQTEHAIGDGIQHFFCPHNGQLVDLALDKATADETLFSGIHRMLQHIELLGQWMPDVAMKTLKSMRKKVGADLLLDLTVCGFECVFAVHNAVNMTRTDAFIETLESLKDTRRKAHKIDLSHTMIMKICIRLLEETRDPIRKEIAAFDVLKAVTEIASDVHQWIAKTSAGLGYDPSTLYLRQDLGKVVALLFQLDADKCYTAGLDGVLLQAFTDDCYEVRHHAAKHLRVFFDVLEDHDEVFAFICSNLSLKTNQAQITLKDSKPTQEAEHDMTSLFLLSCCAHKSPKIERQCVFLICSHLLSKDLVNVAEAYASFLLSSLSDHLGCSSTREYVNYSCLTAILNAKERDDVDGAGVDRLLANCGIKRESPSAELESPKSENTRTHTSALFFCSILQRDCSLLENSHLWGYLAAAPNMLNHAEFHWYCLRMNGVLFPTMLLGGEVKSFDDFLEVCTEVLVRDNGRNDGRHKIDIPTFFGTEAHDTSIVLHAILELVVDDTVPLRPALSRDEALKVTQDVLRGAHPSKESNIRLGNDPCIAFVLQKLKHSIRKAGSWRQKYCLLISVEILVTIMEAPKAARQRSNVTRGASFPLSAAYAMRICTEALSDPNLQEISLRCLKRLLEVSLKWIADFEACFADELFISCCRLDACLSSLPNEESEVRDLIAGILNLLVPELSKSAAGISMLSNLDRFASDKCTGRINRLAEKVTPVEKVNYLAEKASLLPSDVWNKSMANAFVRIRQDCSCSSTAEREALYYSVVKLMKEHKDISAANMENFSFWVSQMGLQTKALSKLSALNVRKQWLSKITSPHDTTVLTMELLALQLFDDDPILAQGALRTLLKMRFIEEIRDEKLKQHLLKERVPSCGLLKMLWDDASFHFPKEEQKLAPSLRGATPFKPDVTDYTELLEFRRVQAGIGTNAWSPGHVAKTRSYQLNVSGGDHPSGLQLALHGLIEMCSSECMELCQEYAHVSNSCCVRLFPLVLMHIAMTQDCMSEAGVAIRDYFQVVLKETQHPDYESLSAVIFEALDSLRILHFTCRKYGTGKPSEVKADGEKWQLIRTVQKWDSCYWLDIDYRDMSTFAYKGQRYLTSLMYLERYFGQVSKGSSSSFSDFIRQRKQNRADCRDRTDSTDERALKAIDDERSELVDRLLHIYKEIDGHDGVYSFLKEMNLKSHLVLFEHEKKWDRVLQVYDDTLGSQDAQDIAQSRSQSVYDPFDGFATCMKSLACPNILSASAREYFSTKTQTTDLSEVQYETCWRQSRWDLPVLMPNDLEGNNLNQGIYNCLHALQHQDMDLFKTSREVIRKYAFDKICACKESELSLDKATTTLEAYIMLGQGASYLAEHSPFILKEKGGAVRLFCDFHKWGSRSPSLTSESETSPYEPFSWGNAFLEDRYDLMEPLFKLRASMYQVLGTPLHKSLLEACLNESFMARRAQNLAKSAAILNHFFRKMKEGANSEVNQGVQHRILEMRIKIEEARVLWEEGLGVVAMEQCRSIYNTFSVLKEAIKVSNVDDQTHLRLLLSEVKLLHGRWLGHSSSEDANSVYECMKKARAESCELWERKKDPHFQEHLADAQASLCKAAFELATFADRQFQSIQKQQESPEWQSRQKLLAFTDRQLELLESRASTRKGVDTQILNHYKATASRFHEEDMEETVTMERKKATFLYSALDNFHNALVAHTSYDKQVAFRLCQIWFMRGGSDRNVNTRVKRLFKVVPSYKFLCLIYQIASRLGTGSPDFRATVELILMRMSINHPHHALKHLHTLINAKKGRDGTERDTKNSTGYAVDSDKVFAARNLLARIEADNERTCEHSAQLRRMIAAYIQLAVLPVKKTSKGAFEAPKMPRSLRELSTLSTPIITADIPIDASCQYEDVPHFSHLKNQITLVGGVNAPKLIVAVDSNGEEHPQLAKSGNDDLRQDAVMQQLFVFVNHLLKSCTSTRKRQLRMMTYNVVPLTPAAGVLAWVKDSVPMMKYLVDNEQPANGAHRRLRPNDWTYRHCLEQVWKVQREAHGDLESRRRMHDLVLSKFKPVMHHFFLETFPETSSWHQSRLAYTRSVAVNSMVGYIVGLGDRHASNILINKSTAEVIHIDLGVAFEQGKVLKIPEVVPFRLTRDMVDGMGASGVEGTMRRSCEEVMRVLRNNKEQLLTIIEVFIHDPLYRWALSPVKALTLQSDKHLLGEGIDREDDGKGWNADAERAILRVRAKLEGLETGERTNVEGQVQKLLREAQDPDRLCKMYCGWGAWL